MSKVKRPLDSKMEGKVPPIEAKDLPPAEIPENDPEQPVAAENEEDKK